MKLQYKLLSVLLGISLLYSCSTDEIDPYMGTEYVYFSNQLVNYTFAYNPGSETIDIGFSLKLIGNSTAYDRVVNFEVEDRSANLSDSDFELVPGVFVPECFRIPFISVVIIPKSFSPKKFP